MLKKYKIAIPNDEEADFIDEMLLEYNKECKPLDQNF